MIILTLPLTKTWSDEARQAAAEARRASTYYHGTGGDRPRIQSTDPEFDRYLFVSQNKEDALGYGPKVLEVTPKAGAKILYEGTPEFDKLTPPVRNAAVIVRNAKASGYDAVHFANQRDLGTAIINRDKLATKVSG